MIAWSHHEPSRWGLRESAFAADSPLEGDGFELSVPRRERSESLSGTGSVMEATKVRLEAVAYLPGTDGSNPFPSSEESAANLINRVFWTSPDRNNHDRPRYRLCHHGSPRLSYADCRGARAETAPVNYGRA